MFDFFLVGLVDNRKINSDNKFGSASEFALNFNRAAHKFDDTFCNAHAQARALNVADGAVAFIGGENFCGEFGRHAHARILHAQFVGAFLVVAADLFKRDGDRAAFGRELERIAD